MSRCFPYPPPGYEKKNAAEDRSLIESIKLQKDKTKAKERKEERKREKKEKRERSKKERHGSSEHAEPGHKKRKHGERSPLGEKDGQSTKAREDAMEQLEKSGLTEEAGPPTIMQNPYDSDPSENSGKRIKPAGAADISHCNKGTILRIKLSSVKHRNVEPPPKDKDVELPAAVEEPCFSGRVDSYTREEAADAARSHICSRRHSHVEKMEGLFRDLMVNWNPPPLHSELSDTDDQEWLFGSRKQPSITGITTCKTGAEALGHGGAMRLLLQPQACYLSDVDVYALPYTVPY